MDEITVPGTLRERVEGVVARRRDLWMIAAVMIVLVFGGLAVRGSEPLIAPSPPPSAPVPATPAAATVLVHVAGAVVHPGLYELPGDARVADAIDAARGARKGADLDSVNLADPVADGAQVLVPHRGQPGPGGPSASPPPPTPLVDLNSADQLALETIPGIGPVTATAILQHRIEIGSFSSLDQLLDVTGIGPATLEAIRPYVSI